MNDLHRLSERLTTLERENRKLKRMGAALAIGFISVLVMGQVAPDPKLVRAQHFVLLDEKGEGVGSWVSGTEQTTLSMRFGEATSSLLAGKFSGMHVAAHGADVEAGVEDGSAPKVTLKKGKKTVGQVP